jgi:hypothetical protein
MLSQQLNLKLNSLTTLQRKLLIDLVRKGYPQFWSRFKSHLYDWIIAKKNLEVFLQNHPTEFLKELNKSGFNEYESTISLKEATQ